MPYFHLLGMIALAIYVIAHFLHKGYYPIVRATVNLLFALMFGTLHAFAPMVIYLFNTLYSIIPLYALVAKMKMPPRARVLFIQGIPAVTAILVGTLAVKSQSMSPLGTVITFAFPILAILINLVIAFVSASGKTWTLAPIARSIVWIVYFIAAGIWVSIVYEIFNLVIYVTALYHRGELPTFHLPEIRLPRIMLPTFQKRERPSRPQRAPKRERKPKRERTPLGNNFTSLADDSKNASQQTTTPAVFKGQW